MDNLIPNELEELILCSCCHLTFNDSDALPKLFACRHYFCLKCINTILMKGKELYCLHCWKRTELPPPDHKADSLPTYNAILYLSQNMINIKAKKMIALNDKSQSPFQQQPVVESPVNKQRLNENCLTHAMPNSLWCLKCNVQVCRACASTEDHRNHPVKSLHEARESIHSDMLADFGKMQKKLSELQHLVFKQRDFLLKILEACTTLKTQIETELINHIPTLEISEIRNGIAKAKVTLNMLETQQSPAEAHKLLTQLFMEKQRLQSKHNEMVLQCKLEDLIQHYGSLLDFELLKQVSSNLSSGIEALTINNNTISSNNNNNSTINGNTVNNNTNNNTNNNGNNISINCSRLFMNLGHNNLILLLANYCISQLYSHHVLTTKTMAQLSSSPSSGATPQLTNLNTLNNNNVFMGSSNMYLPDHPLSIMQDHLLSKYTDLSSSPSNNNNNNLFLQSAEMLALGNGSLPSGNGAFVSSPRQMHAPSQLQTPPPFISDLNGLTMPIAILQHHIQHSNLHLHHSNAATTSGMSTSGTNSQVTSSSLVPNPSVHVYPIYYFNIEINGNPYGRILIEVRNDVAPKMAKNFGALCTGELGFGYKGCSIFQCWENESIITGDFELNNGRGGRSVFEDSFFMPDDTKILAIRGSVGMRRSQKRHDNMGLVGSQFRIILREMRGFTGIFAFVVEGLDLVDKISKAGDSAGKPQSNVIVVNCGKWQ